MSAVAILAASYLGPEGQGNDRTGLRPWPEPLADSFHRGDLAQLHWSLLFQSDPSRFARMDLMCRMGLMAVELLDARLEEMPPERRERMGVCVETCAGSLATDVQFLRTPRPSLFTYTLPSTLVGEICIRYRLQGPVLCLVSSQPGGPGVMAEGSDWLQSGQTGGCLCVTCEAVDRDLVQELAGSGLVTSPAWHAAAVLLGRPEGSQAMPSPAGPASLVELCRTLCRAPKGAC
jgi:3-oxoacyl-(acyl-carrier-protein) synthase